MPTRALCWIRRDLRLSDHAALAHATEQADEVAVVFVYDTVILDALEDKADRRLQFIVSSLDQLAETLRQQGSDLVALHGDPVQLIPQLARDMQADFVVAAEDYEPYALQRDQAVGQQVRLQLVKDQVVFAKREVLSQSGEAFRVFTPYFRAWRAKMTPADIALREPDPAKFIPSNRLAQKGNLTLQQIGFQPTDLWLEPGEDGAQTRLTQFLAKVDQYAENRDLPALDATSGLSVHLRFGTVSVRECVRAVADPTTKGQEKWLAELAWREFYQMILANWPEVARETFRPEYRNLHWPGTRDDFEKWCEGQTGYPIVDAAMRCLNATGWMHNRLRMVTAMFLTKDLLCDPKWGEDYFAKKLLDFDLASNNGGWQWSASTGADAQPYFRIFNPLLQSRKFDPDATFIKRWVPELREAADPHWPHDDMFAPAGYQSPIVDHHAQKPKVLALLGGR